MYTQVYEKKEMTQNEINRNGKAITSLHFVDCHATEHLEIKNKDAHILRGDFKEITFKNEIEENREDKWHSVQLIQLWGAHIEKLKTPVFSNILGTMFHDDAPDKKAFIHSDLLLDDLDIEGVATIHDAEINRLTVQQYANVTIDGPICGRIGSARVFGTLHLSGTVPFEHIELYPGGRVHVWNIEKDDDIPRFVGMRGNVLIQAARGGGFWYFG